MNSLLFFRRVEQYLLLCLFSICLPVLLPAQPVLSTYTPAGNTIATITSDLALTWSTAMSTATVTGANIKVHGSMTGLYTGNTYSYSNGNTTVTINPSLIFRPGELISVSVTTGVRSSGGVNATSATVWSFMAASRPASGLFGGNTNVAIGQQPFTVALGDLNHDGKLDMVTSNPGAFNATVRLGNGIGGFSGGSNVSTGGGTFGMALGDINNDGRLDICAANYNNNTVSIRRGNGNGGFTGNTNISVGDGPWSVALGDLNGDGNLDLAVANFNAGTVSIRLGNGAGNFSGTTEVPVLAGTNSIVLGDLNHDGNLDLVTVDVYSYAVSIRLGNGNGNFSGSTYLSTGYNPYTAALGDVNNDGHLDIALVNSGENNVFVWPGDGDGNFGDPDTVAIGSGAQHLVLADFNGDGNLDIATTNNYDNSVSIRLGDGTGNFSGTTEVAVGGSPTTTAFGDINNDGILDFATTSYDGSNVAVRLGIPIPPVLLAASPSTNASHVPNSTDVRLTFSTTMNVQSLTSANIQITGSQTGRYSTSALIYNSTTNAVRLLPSKDFKPGEIITVSVTTGVRSSESVSITRATVRNFVAASGAASGVFTGNTEVPVGSAPLHVAFGDVNGDGYLDLAAVNSIGNTVSIRLGDGAGNFSGNREISVGVAPVSVTLGDVNRDGRLDIATTSYSTNTVSIRLGNGTGNFSGTTSVPVGSAPFWTTLGDVNGDGYPDIATANYSDSTVSIRLGNGTGNFSGTISVPVGANPTSVVLGDINGDGILDLATANANSNTVSIRLGDGTGNFSGSTEIPVGLYPYHVDLGDINGDGHLDLAAVNSNSNTVSIRLGDGTGNFSGSTEIPVDSAPRKVSISDINGDGYPDIATANSGSSTVSIRLGNGTGTFSGSTEIPVGTAASGIDVGDVNSDGILDIATATYAGNSVSLRLGAPIPSLLSFSPSAHAVNVAPDAKVALTFSLAMDVSSMTSANIRITGNQTGLYNTSTIAYNSTTNTVTLTPSSEFRPGELITVSITTAVKSSAGVNITRATTWSFIVGSGVASGIFSDEPVVFVADTPADIALGDVNNDGKLDIATASKGSNVVAVRLGDGMGNFSGSTNVAVGDAPTSIALVDVNNDGKLDIVATGLQSSTASIRLGDGTGSFSGTTEVAIGRTAYQVALGDFNGDGNADFVVSQQSGNNIAIRFGNGTGNFTGNTEILAGATAGLCTGDINNDGYLDFAVTNTSTNSVSIRFGNGAGGFSNGADVPVGIGPTAITLGDVNGDGYLDIATANTSSNTVSIRLGNGSGTFSGNTTIPVDDEPITIVLGDINGDGKLDLAVTNKNSNTISVRLGNGTGTFSGSATIPTGSNPGGLALGDVNGDAILDLVIANTDDNTVSVRLGVSIPRLLSFSPSTNALNVAPETNARLTFSTGMDVASLTSSTIRTYGSLTGMMSTSALFYNTTTNTLTLHSASTFKPGEIISMSVTTGVRSSSGVSLTSATVWSFTADVQGGVGEFGACLIPTPTSTTHTTSVAVGDLDSDSDLDVFEGNAGQPNKVLLNDGTGNFTTGWSDDQSPLFTSCVALGDVDGDGDLDVFEGTVGTLNKVWLNDGTGNFTAGWQGTHPGSATVSTVFGDFDGDGDLDILEGNVGGNSRVLLNDGTGSFTPGWIRTASSAAGIRVAIGDFDNDGDLDIFETNTDGPNKVWKNNGRGNFTEGWVQSGTPQLTVQALAAGDLDGDGDLDIFEGGVSRPARIWYNNGTGIFTAALITGAPISISSAALGDFDGDDDLDAFAGSRYNTNTLYRNNGNGNFAAAWTQNSPTPTLGVAAGDVDGDGDLDVFTGNENTSNRVWMNEHPPHLALKSANPASMASGGTMILMVDAQRENGTPYTFPADTTLAVILQHPFLSVNKYSTQATFQAGHGSTTISVSVVNFSTTAVTTTLTLSVLNSTVAATSAVLTVGSNYAPQISTTETMISMYENSTTTLTVSIADVETAVTQLTVRVTSGNGMLLPSTSVRQTGSTGATTSFVIIPVTNATGTTLLTCIASDGLYEVSTTLAITVRPIALPANLSATALNNAAQLQWTLSTTAAVTAYELYHGVSSGTLSLLATVSSTTTSYTHTGLSDGIRHYYAIRSVIANAGYSRLSDEVSVFPNTLQMIYPNGAEVLQVGTEHLLRWQYSGDISSMSIEYSTNNGDTWTSITQLVTLAGNKPLTTFYQEWTVADAPTTTALIRVVSLSPSTMEDRSNAVFSISTVSPPSDLVAMAGSTTISLSWTASGSANISGYRILRGTSPENLTALKTVGVTTSSVDTDALACTNYYYAVRTIANATLSPNSNSTSAHIVVPDNLAVLSPNGGEIWQAGIPQNVTWISTGCTRPSTVTIEYSTNNGANWTPVTTTANNGSYTWLLPNIPTSAALVRVHDGSLQDNSNSSFTIAPIPAPTSLSATPGDVSVGLHWTASTAAGLSGYAVYRGATSGSLSLLTTLASTATTYTDTSVTNCTLFVYAVRAIVGTMYSNFSNEVAGTPHTTPILTLLSPAGGEIWQAGVQRTIMWSSVGCTVPESVTIELSTDNAAHWTTVSTTTNTGSYRWLVPDVPTTQALIRVSGSALVDSSASVFTIQPVSAPTHLTAVAGNGNVSLNWTAPPAEGITSYDIYRGMTSGSLSLLTSVASTATWYTDTTAINCAVYRYAIRTRVGSLSSAPSSEAQASPQITPAITVLSPNDNAIWHGGQTQMITWTSTGCTLSANVTLHYSLNNGADWNTIATVANTGSYSWFVPDTSSTQVLVRVSDEATSATTTVLTILPLPVPVITAVQPIVSASYCPGNAMPVTISVALDDPIYPVAALHINVTSSDPSVIANNIVQQGATSATTSFVFTPNATSSSTAVLTVTASNEYATASTTITVDVVVRALPNTTISGITSACISTAYTYAVPPLPGNLYKWIVSGGSIISGTNTHEITVQWNTVGTGRVALTVTGSNGCPAENSLDVAVHTVPIPVITVEGSPIVCAGESVRLTATPASHAYLWSNGATTQSIIATTSGLYTVTVTNEEGCSAISTGVTITVLPEVVATAGQDVTICTNSSVQLNGGGSSSVGHLMFSWIPATGLSNPNVANPIASPLKTTTYTLTITDGNGCSSTATVTVTVLPTPVTTISSNTTICIGGSASLQASGGTTYLWTPATGLNDATISNPIASPSETTTYTVTITTAGGCPVQRSVTVTVNSVIVATVSSDVSICAGNSTQLAATGGEYYVWTPSTGLDNPTIPNPLATPGKTTTYTVVVTGAAGCTSTASVTVTVHPVHLHLSVLLEGPYNGSGMGTYLQAQNLLPVQQPYNVSPFNYTGTETLNVTNGTAVVDWVLVDLRSSTTSESLIERRAGLLTENGSVLASDGQPLAYENLVPGNSYYIVVWHRNHLGVMSSAAPHIDGSCDLVWNFTDSQFAAYNVFADGQKQLRTGVFGMTSGDTEVDGIINAIDRVSIRNMAGMTGYQPQDISLDGIINAVDRVMVRNNAFWVQQLP